MTIGSRQYVPVLKLKPAEKSALSALDPTILNAVIPLFEVVERKPIPAPKPKPPRIPTLDEHLDKAFCELGEGVRLLERYFLDARELGQEGKAGVEGAFLRASKLGHPFTPVTGLMRENDTAAALEHRQHGLAIRVTRQELESPRIGKVLKKFARDHGFDHAEIDLILDLGEVEAMRPPGVGELATMCLSEVPDVRSWRSLILSACGFPKSMGRVDSNSSLLVDRVEWVAWRDLLTTAGTVRIPTFSDCGIQHPVGVEGVDLTIMKSAPSIRYALSEKWLLIKGCTSKLPSEQYSLLAGDLAVGELSCHFNGHRHCVGCERIRRVAEGELQANDRVQWRRFGTIHHITRTVEDIRTVFDQPDAAGRQ